MEIKFFDRIKALEKLREIADEDHRQTAVSFYDALEKSADNVKEKYSEEIYE